MLALTIFTVIISVLVHYTLGTSYSVDIDLTKDLNKNNCGDKSDWDLVNLKSIGVNDSDDDVFGLVATRNSCVTTSPVAFKNGSALEVHVYMQVTSESSGITVILSEEFGGSIVTRHEFNGAVGDITSGWSKIVIPIEKDAIGRISLLGAALEDELIIINYIKYLLPHDSSLKDSDLIATEETAKKQNVLYESNNSYNYQIYSNELSSRTEVDDNIETTEPNLWASIAPYDDETTTTTSSATDPGEFTTETSWPTTTTDEVTVETPQTETSWPTITTDETPGTDNGEETTESNETTTPNLIETTDPIETDESTTELPPPTVEPVIESEDETFWTWINIALVSGAGCLFIIILSVVCYKLGKRRSKPVILDSAAVDLPRTVIIPRVKDVSSIPIRYD